jgi:hypothetical protein
MSLLSFFQWLEATQWSIAIRESDWIFPFIETVHVLALSVMLFPTALMDLRLLGLVMRGESVSKVRSQLMPWIWSGFAVMIVSGIFVLWSHPVKYYNSPFARAKAVLLVLAGMNAMVFELTGGRNAAAWDQGLTPLRVKLAGGLSLLIWIAVVVMGRAIAYG